MNIMYSFMIGLLLNGILWRYKTGLMDDIAFPIVLCFLFFVMLVSNLLGKE